MVVHAYNLSTWEVEAKNQEFEVNLSYERYCLKNKNKQIKGKQDLHISLLFKKPH